MFPKNPKHSFLPTFYCLSSEKSNEWKVKKEVQKDKNCSLKKHTGNGKIVALTEKTLINDLTKFEDQLLVIDFQKNILFITLLYQKDKNQTHFVRTVELSYINLTFVSRILWYKRITPSLNESRLYLILTSLFLLYTFLLTSIHSTISMNYAHFIGKK